MKRYYGGEAVSKGVYLNLTSGEYMQLYNEPRVLLGDDQVKYLKVPGVVALLMGGMGGMAFVIFLPVIGIVGAIGFLAYVMGKRILHRQQADFGQQQEGWPYFLGEKGLLKNKQLSDEIT